MKMTCDKCGCGYEHEFTQIPQYACPKCFPGFPVKVSEVFEGGYPVIEETHAKEPSLDGISDKGIERGLNDH